MAQSYSIDYGNLRGRAAPGPPLEGDESGFDRIIHAPLYESLPLIVRRLLAAEKRIAELEAKLPSP
jgi:hypothetical protein